MVVDNVPIVLWAVDAQGIITLTEGKGLARLGIDPGQSVGKSIFDLYANTPAVSDSVRAALAGEERAYTTVLAGRVFESLCTPMRDEKTGAVTGVLGFSIDVSERASAEREKASLQIGRASCRERV